LIRPAKALIFAIATVVAAASFPIHDAPAATTDAAPSSAPLPTESAIIEIQEGPPTASPSPSPTPSPTPRFRRRGAPTPAPSPTPEPTPKPPEPTISMSRNTDSRPNALPTVIPTQRATPRPIAPYQPTIPQSLEDPNVQAIIHRSIAQISTLGWMAGTWRAHNVEELGDGRQRDLGVNTYVFAATMKGRWIFGGDGKATDYFYLTYDPFAEHWTLVRINGNPSYGIWISERGWRGNSIEFTSSYSYANGRQYNRRITIIHKDVRTFGIYDEEQLSDGSWTGDDAVELTRQQ